MNAYYFEDNLLVSSPGVGGLTYLEGESQVIISTKAATGIYLGVEGFFCGLQESGGNQLIFAKDGSCRLVELDNCALDIHDVIVSNGLIYFVATQKNEIVCLDSKFKRLNSWQLPGEEDSCHINSLVVYNGRLIASAFGSFRMHREYKTGTLGLGRVFDVQTGETLISGLSQPHSLTTEGDYLYLCSSEENKVFIYQGQELVDTVSVPGYARGLAVGKNYIYVGISLSRNVSNENSKLNNGAIAIFNKKSMEFMGLNMLKFREVYDIRIVNQYCNIFSMLDLQKIEINTLKESLEKCKYQMEGCNAIIADNNKRIEGMVTSMSWRLTSPLRALGTALSKLKNKAKK